MPISSIHNLDIYIKECTDCAQTCRACAEAHADNAKKFAKYIAACLECAETCEATAKALLLHKNGIKNIQQAQLEACVIACRLCAQICERLGEKIECFKACAESARRCEEIMRALLRSASPKRSAKAATFLKLLVQRRVAL
jgi:hypothetical protein